MSTSTPARIRRHPPRNVRKRPRNRRKPNYKLLFGLFVLSVVLSGAASFAVQTPALTVREVQIKGVRLAERAKVEKAARAALGRNILLVRTTPISRQVAKLSEVAAVTTGRSFPDTLWVRVKERKPAAVVADSCVACMVQDDGLVFHLTDGPVNGVPVVQIACHERMREGRKLESAEVAGALEVLKTARRNGLSVAKISVDPVGDMCLNMEGGFYVKLGQPDEIARKMSALRTALVYKPSIAREAAYIDLSCPSAPVWKPKAGVRC